MGELGIGVNEMTVAALAIVGIFFIPVISIAGLLFYLFRTRYKERMELIKQGLVPSAQVKATPNKYIALRNGCLAISLAFGIILGMIIDSLIDYSDMGSFLIMVSSAVLFLGIGYTVYYLLVKNNEIDEE